MTWNPTHRVPDGGLASYVDNQPSTPLAPGLEVEVAEWSGSWARVIASNGWECWVDGGELVPVAAAAAPMAAAAATGPPPAEAPPATASAPPPTYVPPAQPSQQPKRSGPPWIPILIGVIILLLIVGGAGGGYLILNANAADVTLEQSSQQSAQPFQPAVTVPSAAPSASATAAPSTPPTAAPKGPSGVAIYGGSGNNRICDKQKLIDFLTTHPSEAAAWASVEGISTAQIPDFIRQLSPEILSQDVRVTNHGFANGRATTYQSVFQAGTAVLVNQYGYPVVRCLCGNPLTPPTSNQRVRYTGDRWPGFNQTTIIIYVAPPGNVPNVPSENGQSPSPAKPQLGSVAGPY
ncbi:MAG: hypothetical protein M3O87_06580, partial [Candidatus Dormibacteraeota bacterium]|nr:hypothetical protein [Candidatus Dormibacteraeota bacterium]